jgi:hypothetical protein
MKRSAQIFVVAMTLVDFAPTSWGQHPEPQMRQPETLVSAIKSTWGFLETDFISLADAMPAENSPLPRYGRAPRLNGIIPLAGRPQSLTC